MKIAGITLPSISVTKNDLTEPKNLALGGIAATALVGGGVIGALRGSPLKGLGIGAAVAAVALGAAMLGNASSSRRDGWCDDWNDPDCDYPGVGPSPYHPANDPLYPVVPRYPGDGHYHPLDPFPPTYPYPHSAGSTSPGDS